MQARLRLVIVKAMIQVLLQHGGNPNVLNVGMNHHSDGGSLLHVASRYGHLDIVMLLLEYGSEHLLKDRLGRTACEVAHKHHNSVIGT